MSDFLDKLKKVRENVQNQTSDAVLNEDAQVHLLLALRSSVEAVVSQSELEEQLQDDLLIRINHADPEQRLTNQQKIDLLEVLKKKKSSDLIGILNVLKQQVVNVQQNNFGLLPNMVKKDEKEINGGLSHEQVRKGKKLLDFIDKVKSIGDKNEE